MSAAEAAIPGPMHGAVGPTEQPKVDEKTYGQVLKSTALVGGSSVVKIAMAMVRTLTPCSCCWAARMVPSLVVSPHFVTTC
jgi:hypothetical protein